MTEEQLKLEARRLIVEEKLTLEEITKKLNITIQKSVNIVGQLKRSNLLDKNYIIKKDVNLGVISNEEVKKAQENIVEFTSNKTSKEENKNPKIEVVKVNFEKVEQTTYESLFDGFDEMYAITYSSSPDFIYNLSKKFEYMEIIFGSSSVLNGTVANMFASQMYSIDLIKKSKYQDELIKRIEENTLSVFLQY